MAQDLHMDMGDARDEQPAAAEEEEKRRYSRIRAVSSTPSERTDKNIPQKRGTPVDVDPPQPTGVTRF